MSEQKAKQKVSRKYSRSQIVIMWVFLVCVGLALRLHVEHLNRAPVYISETLKLSNANSVTSQNKYSGGVTITISGYGSFEDGALHDAFYTFGKHQALEETFYGLRINHQETNFYVFGGLFPAYNPAHEYHFSYYLIEPSYIDFEFVGFEDAANSPRDFTITISTEPLDKGR